MSMDSSIGRPPYRPTNSVRIVEFSIPNIDIRKYSTEVDVQIWEIGGNPRYKEFGNEIQIDIWENSHFNEYYNEMHIFY